MNGLSKLLAVLLRTVSASELGLRPDSVSGLSTSQSGLAAHAQLTHARSDRMGKIKSEPEAEPEAAEPAVKEKKSKKREREAEEEPPKEKKRKRKDAEEEAVEEAAEEERPKKKEKKEKKGKKSEDQAPADAEEPEKDPLALENFRLSRDVKVCDLQLAVSRRLTALLLLFPGGWAACGPTADARPASAAATTAGGAPRQRGQGPVPDSGADLQRRFRREGSHWPRQDRPGKRLPLAPPSAPARPPISA